MLINLRNALMAGKRLPYDAEVEYLESTGTQYVNTGVLIDTSTDTVEITFMPHAETSGYQAYYGTDETGNGQFSLRKNTNGNNIQVLKGTGVSAGITADEKWHTVKVTPNKAIVDGIDIALTQADAQYTKSLMLFARITTVDTITAYAKCRIASFKIYRNGVLVRDFIPVRKGTVGYLYDRVSRKLFGNAGTGDFVVGPDIVPVEYIESHGTEWIDTGFKITNATSFAYDVKFTLATTITKTEPRVFSNEGAGSGAYYDIYLLTSTNILSIRQSGTTAQISRRDVPIIATMDEYGVYRGYYEDTPQTPLYEATRAFVAPTTDRDYRIFSRGNNTSSQFLWQGKLYWLNFTKNGEPSRRYRPVRVGTEGAMMDVLTRRVYRNAGTGAFAYGNDLKYPIPAE